SMPGMRTSRRMTAKSCFSTRRSASSPDCAVIRLPPGSESSWRSANRLLGSSSTSRMFACAAALSACASPFSAAMVSAALTLAPSTNQLMPHGVMNERGVAGETELAQDARAIGAHRARRKAHLAGDLADLLAGREQPHDAVLAVGQLLVQRLLRIARAFGGEDLRERRAHVLAAVRDLAHRGGKLLRRAVLGDVAGCAAAQRARAVHVFR